MSITDLIGLYGAVLSTAIIAVAVWRHFYRARKIKREKAKVQFTLYLLNKVDRNTKKTFPIVVVMLANLGTERVSFKGLHYTGISNHGSKCTGTPGWYEEPEAAYGIMKRLLPVVLESGQTVDLPMLTTSVFKNNKDLRIWLEDFDNNKRYIPDSEVSDMQKKVTELNK